MIIENIIICLLCAMTCASCVDLNVLNMMLSFVTIDDRITAVLLYHLCWTPYEIRYLAKMLFEVNINVANSTQKNRNEFFLQHVLLVADLSCPGIDTRLVQASEDGFFKAPYRWLLLEDQDLDTLQPLDALVDSDVVIARKSEEMDYIFFEAYKIAENTEVIYYTRAIWRPRNNPKLESSIVNITTVKNDDPIASPVEIEIYVGTKDEGTFEVASKSKKTITGKYGIIEDLRDSKVLATRRMNLRGHTLTMMNVITDSNETRKHLADRLQLRQDGITKMSYMAMSLCLDILNSTENITFTNTWGYKDKNGNWQGLIENLMKKQADLGTITTFTTERMELIDYIAMVGATAIRLVFREPPLTYQSNIFTLPFTGAVWLAILVCILGCAVLLYISTKWEASMTMEPTQLDGSWTDVFILIVGALLQQGCTLEPQFATGRCVVLLLLISCTILFAAYSANIVSLLQAPSDSIKTLQDLLDAPLTFAASDMDYNRYFFSKLNDTVRKAIFDKKFTPNGQKVKYLSIEEGVELVRRGLFAFHMETNPGYRLIQETYQEHEKCDLVEIDYINENAPWVPGQRRSPLKELFKINFIKIRETGLQSCITHRMVVSRPRCSGSVSTFSSVGFIDMYPAMLATFYGMLMALAVLMFEIVYKRVITKKKSRRHRSEPTRYITIR